VSTLAEPRANPLLVGHVGAVAQIVDAMRAGRLHHAWLVTGKPGIGKATLAFRFARGLLAGGTPDDALGLPEKSPAFRRIAAGTHADLLTVEREWDPKRKKLRGEIIVDDVRGIADFLHRTPAEGGWRVVVLDGAEDLNRNAANALLKMLEEPPRRAVLILVCSAAGRLLPTIRSRCRRLRLDPLSEDEMARLLATALPDTRADERARLAALAEGSPGRALQLAGEGGIAVAEMVTGVLKKLPGLTLEHAHETADKLGRDEDAFGTFMDLLRAELSAAVREAARGRADPIQARMLGAAPLDAWVEVWQRLTRLQRETEDFYLDKRQALVTSFQMLATGV
jgi:DNA polymerase-3 subunit delta'